MPTTLLELITSRRTVYDFKPRAVDPNLIKQCLTAAIWAPNHGLTQPWRFWVLGPQTQAQFAKIHGQMRAEKKFSPESDDFHKAYESAKQRIQSIPVIILVGQIRAKNSMSMREDYAACGCAIQNFQLAAWELGLGCQWSSAPAVQHPKMVEALEIDSTETELIHAIYCGYPENIPSPSRLPLEKVCYFTD